MSAAPAGPSRLEGGCPQVFFGDMLERVDLRHALSLTLAMTPLGGCYLHCLSIPEERFEFTAEVSVGELDRLLGIYELGEYEELPCERVCEHAYRRARGWQVHHDGVSSCALELPKIAEPGQDATVTCEGVGVEYFCKGRRPLGYVETFAEPIGAGLGPTLATMARLEAASVLAFEQLAGQLADLDAPEPLRERCRAAAADERNHARWLTILAERCGVPVGKAQLDARAYDRVEIAMHNAVEGCVHEAFAALVAAVVARIGASPVLRRIYTRIAVDETRHGQLAWDLHEWLVGRLSPPERERVEAARSEALARLPERVGWLAELPREFGSVSASDARLLASNFASTAAARR